MRNPEIGILPTGNGDQVLLYVDFGNDQGFVLDYYDTEKEGVSVAWHFSKCCEMAVKEGFSLIPGFFVRHATGHGITVAEALDETVSPSEFRHVLKELKNGRYNSRRQR